jgi:hypothetical protein
MALLPQWISCDQPLGVTDRLWPALMVRMPARQILEGLQVKPSEPLTLVHEPVVIATLQ